MAKGRIEFDVGINTSKAKSSLNELAAAFEQIQKLSPSNLTERGRKTGIPGLEQLKKDAKTVESIFNRNYNFKLNTLNIEQFRAELRKNNIDLEVFQQRCNKAGAAGQAAFRNLTMGIMNSNEEMKETHTLLKRMGDTLMNTVRWSVASTAINKLTGSIQKAWSFTKDLDESLNNIRIVTGYSSEEMDRFAKKANEAAKSLGASTTEYTNAALIYYQQGLSGEQVTQRTNVTTKVANVTGQNAETVSNQLTAIWNGYKVSAQEAEKYIDKVSAVAASTAADLAELSEGMGKVASAANSMGVDVDQLNASLSTIISVTRQDASAIGTSLKTIFSRIGDLAIGGEDEFGVKLGDVSSQLKKVGIDVLDTSGNLRDMGMVIEEIGGKWDQWSKAQQQAIAIAVAGKRQYNNLIALFENWDMYQSALTTSQQSVGELERQQSVYLDSLEAKFEKLSATAETLYMDILDSDAFKSIIDGLTEVLDLLNKFIKSIGGVGPLLSGLGAIALKVFSSSIGSSIGTSIWNIGVAQKNLKRIQDEIKENEAKLANSHSGSKEERERLQRIIELKQEELKYTDLLSEEDKKRYGAMLNDLNDVYSEESQLEELRKRSQETYERQAKTLNREGDKFVTGKHITFAENPKETEKPGTYIHPETAAKHLKKVGDQLKSDLKDIEALNRQTFNAASVDKKVEAVDKESEAFEGLVKKYNLVIDKDSDLAKAQQAYATLYEKATNPAIKDQNLLQEYRNKLEQAAINLSAEYEAAIRKEADANQEAAEFTENYTEILDKHISKKNAAEKQANTEKTKLDYKKIGQSFAELGSAVAGVTGGIQSLQSTWQVFNSQDLDIGEKISQGLPAAIAGITMLGTSAKTLYVTLTTTLAPFLPVILGIAAAIGAIALSVKLQSDSLNKEQQAAERAVKSAQKQKENYDALKSSYDNLIASIERYQEAQKAIDSLAEGTKEWRNAIQEANEEVIELIKNYPQLAKYLDKTRDDGRLIFTEEGLEIAKNAAADSVAVAYGAKLTADMAQNTAQNRATAEKIANNTDTADFWSFYKGMLTFGSPISLISQLITHKGDLGRLFTDRRASVDDIRKVAELYQDEDNVDMFVSENNLRNTLEANGIEATKELTEALMANSKEIVELSQSMENETLVNESLNTEIMRSYLQINSDVFNQSQNQGQIASIAGHKYQKQFEKEYEYFKDGGSGGVTDAEIQQRYGAYMVATGQWQKLLGATNKNGNKGQYSYIDLDGQPQNVEIDDDVARQAVAGYEASKKVGTSQNITKIQEAINAINANAGSSNIGNALLNSGLINGSKEGNLDSLTRDEIIGLNEDIVNGVFKLTDEQAQDLEYSNFEAYKKALQDTIEKYLSEDDALLPDEEELKSSAAWQSLNKTSKKVFADYYNQLAEENYEAKEKLVGILKSSSEENAQDLIDLMSSVDWSDLNSVEDFRLKIQKLLPELLPEDLEVVIGGMRRIAAEYGEFSVKKMQAEYSQLSSIVSKLKDLGDTISTEEFDSLTPELKSYFSMMADGTYALTVSALDFADAASRVFEERKKLALADAIDKRDDIQTELNSLNIETFRREARNREIEELEADKKGIDKNTIFRDAKGQEYFEWAEGFGRKYVNSNVINYDQLFKMANFVSKRSGKSLEDVMGAESLSNFNNGYAVLTDDVRRVIDAYNAYENKIDENAIDTAAKGAFEARKQALKEALKTADENVDEVAKYVLSAAATDEEVDALQAEFSDVITKEMAEARKTQKNEVDFGVTGLEKYEQTLERINRQYEALDKEIENSFGEEKRNKLARQNELLKEQVETLDAELTTLKENARDIYEDEEFSKALANYGYSISDLINPDGTINYELLNDIEEQVNKTLRGSQLGDADNKRAQKIKEYLEEFEGTVDQIYDKTEQREDALAKQRDNNLQIFEDKISDTTKKYDIIKEYRDFVRQITIDEEDYYNLSKSYLEDFNVSTNKIAELQKEILEVDSLDIEEKDKIAKKTELQKELQQEILSQKELLKNLDQNQINQLNKLNESYQKQIDYLENINKLINNQIKMTELLGGNNRDTLNAFYDRQVTQSQRAVDVRRDAYSSARTHYQNLIAQGASEDVIEVARQAMIDAGQQLSDAMVALAEITKEQYSRTIEDRFAEIFGTTDFESIAESQEWIDKEADSHYDAVEKVYAMREVENKFNQAINNTKDVEAQRKILDLKEKQLKILEDEDKLTEKDVERAYAKLDVLQAEIALRDAQQSKTQMQLTRNADGTYSYQYVADSANILEKEQALADAQKNLYSIDKEQYRNNLNSILDMTTTFFEKLKKALIDDGAIDGAEKIVLGKAYEMMKEMIERNDLFADNSFVANLMESIKGTEGFENLSDDEIKALFPEYSPDFMRLISAIGNGLSFDDFIAFFENFSTEEMQAIWKNLEAIGIDIGKLTDESGSDNEKGLTDAQDNTEAYEGQTEAVVNLTSKIKELNTSYETLTESILKVSKAISESLLVDQNLVNGKYEADVALGAVDAGSYSEILETAVKNSALSAYNNKLMQAMQSAKTNGVLNIEPKNTVENMDVKVELVMPNVTNGSDANQILEVLGGLPQAAIQDAFKNNKTSNKWLSSN